jgi:hypothetical protein
VRYLSVKPVISRTGTLPYWPRLYRTVCQEVDVPFRTDRRALVVRLTGQHGLVFAVLRHRGVVDEDAALKEVGMRTYGPWKASAAEREESGSATSCA